MAASEVDDFVDALTVAWQKEQCAEVLRITRAASVPLRELIKWGNPFFEHNGAAVKWFVAKEWINVYFYKGYLIADPEGCFEPSENSKMRTVKLYAGKPLNVTALERLLDEAVKLNLRKSG